MSRLWMLLAAAALGLLCALPLSPLRAEEKGHAAEVTLLEGTAELTAAKAAAARALKKGDRVGQGDEIATHESARLELRLEDKSVLRLGPSSKLALTEAQFGGGEKSRKLNVKLIVGNIWAKVTSVVSGDQRFAVETENAVAGVRGTTFRVDAHADKSVLVRVYAGAVAVAKPVPIYATGTASERHEVAGPEEVTRAAWEKLVGRQMEIVIAADGTPGEPSKFSDADEKGDAWAKWNEARDAK